MKNRLIEAMYFPARLLPMRWMIRLSGQALFAPFYHSVRGQQAIPHIEHLYRLRDVRQFEKDLDAFLRHFQPIDLTTLLQQVQSGNLPSQPALFLSFDDGLREVYELVAPILRAKGVPATFFLNSAFVDNRALFYRYKVSLLIDRFKKQPPSAACLDEMQTAFFKYDLLSDDPIHNLLSVHYPQRAVLPRIALLLEVDFDSYLAASKPYMDRTQIEELIDQGFTFGGHSVDHPLYAGLALDQQLRQTQESIDFICQHFGIDYRVFAFPFHCLGVKKRFFEAVQDRQISQLTFGTSGLKLEDVPYHLHRFAMEESDLPASRLVRTQYFYYLVKSLLKKNRLQRT